MNIQLSVVASDQTQGSAATGREKLLQWMNSPARGLGRGVSLPSSHTVASLWCVGGSPFMRFSLPATCELVI